MVWFKNREGDAVATVAIMSGLSLGNCSILLSLHNTVYKAALPNFQSLFSVVSLVSEQDAYYATALVLL